MLAGGWGCGFLCVFVPDVARASMVSRRARGRIVNVRAAGR